MSRRGWLLAAVLAAPVIGLIGVVAAEVVPDGRIAAQLVNAMNRDEIGIDDRTTSLLGTTADHFAECTAVMVGLGDPDGSIVRRALFSATGYGCDDAVIELSAFAATGVLDPQGDYMRYWHGYTALTRPALAIFGLSGTRWIAFAVLGAAVAVFTVSVARRFGAVAAGLVTIPALLTTDLIGYGWSISQALGMATAWAGATLVLWEVERDRNWRTAALAAALAGVLNAYVDLMVAIPMSLVLCAVAAGLATLTPGHRPDPGTPGHRPDPGERGGVDPRRTATVMAAAVGGWGLGLAWMWVAKWALAWLFVDRQAIVDSVRNQIEFRTSGEHGDVTGTRFNGFWKNADYWWIQPLTPLVVVAALAAVAYLVWRVRRPPDARVAACALIAAVPFVAWYIVLNNHNQIHFWQTYRSVAVAFGAVLAFVAVAIAVAANTETGDPSAEGARYAVVNGDDEAITSEPPEEQDPTPQVLSPQ